MKMLSNLTIKDVAAVLDATLEKFDENASFTSVSTDTRKIENNGLFVALKGPNFDGHVYLDVAKANGAVAAVVEDSSEVSLTQIKVPSTLSALGIMAAARRRAFPGKVIGLTGSNGKTTVKEMIAHLLERKGNVLSTDGNFNNDIGLPLTIMRLKNNESFAVIEMGANHPGEIDYLSHITQPDIALITNAGAAHLEGFGSLEGVAEAKGEIFDHLAENGTAVVNLDDNFSGRWLARTTKFKTKTFSIENENADVYAKNISIKQNVSEFDLCIRSSGEIHVCLPLSGKHNVANAMVSSLVADECGLALGEIKVGLESFNMVNGRLTFKTGINGSVVIDDTYNANLDSSKAAIDVLSEQVGETYFIFGDLFESGDNAIAIHQEVGKYAKEKDVRHFYAVGDLTKHSVENFGQGARHFPDKKTLSEFLSNQVNKESTILVKGSRGMKMEQIVSEVVV